MLYNWDAVQFALALAEFDVAKHQPHPPGLSPLRRAGPARQSLGGRSGAGLRRPRDAVQRGDDLRGLLAGAAPLRSDHRLAAAALLAVSPLFWFYGSVGLTYAGEAFGASLVAWWAWARSRGRARHLYLGALALGLVGGMRQSVLVLIVPALARRARCSACAPWRRVAAARRASLAAAVLAWLLPTIWLSGGLGRLRRRLDPALRLGGAAHLGARRVARRHLRPGALPRGVGHRRASGRSRSRSSRCPRTCAGRGWGREEWFLLAWIVPPAAFYALVHFGQAGYVLTFLPALVILLARALVEAVAAGLRAAAPAELALGADRRGRWCALVLDQYRLLRPRPSACRASSTTGRAIPGSGGPATRSTTGS